MTHEETFVLIAVSDDYEPVLIYKGDKENCELLRQQHAEKCQVVLDGLIAIDQDPQYKIRVASDIGITITEEYFQYLRNIRKALTQAKAEFLKQNPYPEWYSTELYIL